MGTTLMPGSRRRGGFSNTARSYRHPRRHLWQPRAGHWLRVLADTWVNADVPEARADLLHAIYDRSVGRPDDLPECRPVRARQRVQLHRFRQTLERVRPPCFELQAGPDR